MSSLFPKLARMKTCFKKNCLNVMLIPFVLLSVTSCSNQFGELSYNETLGFITVAISAAPNNFDPRLTNDQASSRIFQLVYSSLMVLDDDLKVKPSLATNLENPDPLTYIAHLKQGVYFHHNQELTSADVVFTFESIIDQNSISPRKGAYRALDSVTALDRYTVQFKLTEPFGAFPMQLVMPIVPKESNRPLQSFPIGTGPYKFERYLVDDQVVLSSFKNYYGGKSLNNGLVLKVIPDDTMRGLELRKGTIDLVINDISPDIVSQLIKDGHLRVVTSPGTDYAYIGLNLRDPILSEKKVRHALSYAINREAIIKHLRQGFASVSIGILPPYMWAFEPDVYRFKYDPDRSRQILDDAGYTDPDGEGPLPRFNLSLKISNDEFIRLQAAVIQEDLRQVGIGLDVRSYEFATMYADLLKGNFQLVTMQWVGGSVADPDILRRIFHSDQSPPNGFNRGHYSNPKVDELLNSASRAIDINSRKKLYGAAQREIAVDAPYISLWHKTNVAVTQPSISGLKLSPDAAFINLKDATRVVELEEATAN
jgi:peptide/nickel transport system substrate-binding protein